MAQLDLTAVTKPTDGRTESQHGVDVGTVFTLVLGPERRKIRSMAVRGNDGGLIWSFDAAEGGTPNANDPKVPQASDDEVVPVGPLDISSRRVVFGLASQTGTVQAIVFIKWR